MDHELFLKRPPICGAGAGTGGSVQYEKEFHKIRIFDLYEDPSGSGSFTSGF
jgi:hypothetical protein